MCMLKTVLKEWPAPAVHLTIFINILKLLLLLLLFTNSDHAHMMHPVYRIYSYYKHSTRTSSNFPLLLSFQQKCIRLSSNFMYTSPFLISGDKVVPLRVIFPALNSTTLRGSLLVLPPSPKRAMMPPRSIR